MSEFKSADFYGMAEESNRLLARQAESRGLGGGGTPKLTRTGPPRALPAIRLPQPSTPIGTRAGEAVRSGFTRASNAAIGGLEASTNELTAPARLAGGFSRDFTRALTGAPAGTDAGKPLPGLSLPRLTRAPAPAAVASPRAPRGGRPYAETIQAPEMRPAAPQGSEGTADLVPGGLNTFTGSNGRTVAVSPAVAEPAAPEPPMPRLTRAPNLSSFDPQGITQQAVADLRGVATTVRDDAASGLNPMSADTEILRRLEHSQGSYFNKGRPSARAAQAQAYLGQLSARQGASQAFQEGAGQAVQAGTTGAVQEGLDAQQIEGRAALDRQGLEGALELASAAENRPKLVRNSADGILRVRRGTTATAVTDENGQPIRQESMPEPGALTPQALLKSYTTEREAIAGSLASQAEKAAAFAALDSNPLYKPLLGQGVEQPSLEEFLVGAREANPKASDQELLEYYRNEYGSP